MPDSIGAATAQNIKRIIDEALSIETNNATVGIDTTDKSASWNWSAQMQEKEILFSTGFPDMRLHGLVLGQ